jgi:alpha-galactosidase
MRYVDHKVEGVKIAYIGGGSRGWAWGLMSDLASAGDICGDVFLYDINFEAAKANETIGNRIQALPECRSSWNYHAVKTIGEALTGADFVVISILPGTFDEMQSDVHTPEKYGIYQSVGDTSGPGGIIRALRTVPMIEQIALAIKEFAPDAWVINYTNPMTVCVKTLYNTFPEIKAFGCCHEVFGTQKVLVNALADICGIENAPRDEIKVNVLSVNHFTWFTEAKYRNIDLFDVYRQYVEKYAETGTPEQADQNWLNKYLKCEERVKFDLFRRYGYIAAAGDRHLAEFCPGDWYLKNPEQVDDWGFSLTPVSWRKEDLQNRLQRSARLLSGEEEFKIEATGEEGVRQIRALLGLGDIVTNVNIPNRGQVPNLPMDSIVETNAVFSADSVRPVFAGNVPASIYPLVSKAAGQQEAVAKACRDRDLEAAFRAFANDNLVRLPLEEARLLFDEMVENTKDYLVEYFR